MTTNDSILQQIYWLILLKKYRFQDTRSGWRDVEIGHFFWAWFLKQQNNWCDGVKMVHGDKAW